MVDLVGATSVSEIFERHAHELGDRQAVAIVGNPVDPESAQWLTYAQLDQAARVFAQELRQACPVGSRVLLLHPTSAEFVAAVVGCLYAGMVAVPSSMPGRYKQDQRRVLGIAHDADVGCVLTTPGERDEVLAWAEQQGFDVPVLALRIDLTRHAEDFGTFPADQQTLAVLQYTSGSTNAPKGSMVTHGNLLANAAGTAGAFPPRAGQMYGGWLPNYHGMGLMGIILTPLLAGFGTALMSPAAFLRRPRAWLELVDRFDIALSPAPNFAYELCLSRMADDDLGGLDLSRWTYAGSGSEPVNAGVLDAFAQRFAPAGFRPERFAPSFGMAEATLLVSTSPGRRPVVLRCDPDALERNRVEPVGFEAVVAADEREETPAAGAAALDEYGILAEFVPDRLGGRLQRVDHLIELMRSVYRRDPSLGLGHCSSSLIGSVNVWTAGSPAQHRAAADLLLAGAKISCAFHELAHGNDIGSVEFAAGPAGDGLVLNGRKETISNLDRADAVVFLARTDARGGPRSCSQLFVPVTVLDPDRVSFLPRFRSMGMRGVRLGGITVNDCPVGTETLLGAPGTGLETTARAFQLTRIALPAMSTAMLDTALRVTLHHVRRRRLYGRHVTDIPMVRTTLANAFADLLLCEAFAAVAARSLHVLPESGSVYAPAVKFLLAGVLLDALEQLSLVMGAEFYRRDGEHAIFQKMARDIRPIGFGHIARAACLSATLPQLPVLARRSWRDAAPAPSALFVPDAALPSLNLPGLRLVAGGRDALAPSLGAALDDDLPDRVRPLVESHARRLAALADACAGLGPRDLSIAASVEVRDLAAQYAAALAAAACVGVAQHAPDGDFLARPEWLVAALTRLTGMGVERPGDGPKWRARSWTSCWPATTTR